MAVVGVKTTVLVSAANEMTRLGRKIAAAAGGVERTGIQFPEDDLGLGMRCVKLDEARESFDRRLGERFEEAGARLAIQAFEAASADEGSEFAHLPLAGR